MYKVVYLDHVQSDLEKLDKTTIRKIFRKIETHLVRDPYRFGKPLKGEFKGYWRYRFGDYRVIYKISKKEILIYILRIAHRSTVYE